MADVAASPFQPMHALRLIVGLGNPGPEHAKTRHNAGFRFVDELATQAGARWSVEGKLFGEAAKASVGGRDVWLLKPATFMNLSGKSVGALARFFKIQPEEVLVVHDELDFEPGIVKLKHGGSHGGHNGLRDIHAQLGSPNYWRLRVGIGHPGNKGEVANWVLKKPSPDHMKLIEDALIHSLKSWPEMVAGQMDKATLAIHTTKAPRPKPPRKPAPDTAAEDKA